MKKAYLGVKNYLGVVVVALLASTLTPTAGWNVTGAGRMDTDVLSERFHAQLTETAIVCTFVCQDGSGFALNPCTDGSLGACCANGQPACADHGGLESGICQQGRLGLPCTPF